MHMDSFLSLTLSHSHTHPFISSVSSSSSISCDSCDPIWLEFNGSVVKPFDISKLVCLTFAVVLLAELVDVRHFGRPSAHFMSLHFAWSHFIYSLPHLIEICLHHLPVWSSQKWASPSSQKDGFDARLCANSNWQILRLTSLCILWVVFALLLSWRLFLCDLWSLARAGFYCPSFLLVSSSCLCSSSVGWGDLRWWSRRIIMVFIDQQHWRHNCSLGLQNFLLVIWVIWEK